MWGMTKSGRSAYSRSSGSWNVDSRKNQLSSRSISSTIWWIGQRLPSSSSDSVLKSAQRGQYQPSWGDPERLGRLGDRLPVLVRTGEEEDVLAPLPHVPREHVGGNGRVGVPEMGLAVHVVDRRCDVVGHRQPMLPMRARSTGDGAGRWRGATR